VLHEKKVAIGTTVELSVARDDAHWNCCW